jgi:beta-galactosidase
MDDSLIQQKIYIGAAYYPELWPEERWPEDIRLMQQVGFNVV